MEKPCDLFLQEDGDNATALDDLLSGSGRQEDAEWHFKSDFLTVVSPRFDEISDVERSETISESFEESHCLESLETKPSGVSEAKTSENNIVTFEKYNNRLREMTKEESYLEPISSNSSSIGVANQGSTTMSTLSSDVSRYNQGKNEEMNEELGQPNASCSETNIEQTVRSIQRRYSFWSDDVERNVMRGSSIRKEVQKPPTTAGIGLDDLKAVFHLERPKAEKKLRLKRTTFSNLSRHYGISKWPFRTIRDATNRMEANRRLLMNRSVSKERQRKLSEQQRLLSGVIELIYSDPRESRDSNTLAVLLRIVAARESPSQFSDI